MITVTGTRENYIAEMTADRGTLNATHCDIPVEQGGQNAYMRPGETLLSALGACMNITARKYLNRDGLDYDSVTVKAEMARENGVTKTALITVGRFLGTEYERSKLYDPTFSHGCREARE